MANWVSGSLLIFGILLVIVELALGALTGFDLALVGASLAAGGVIGLLSGSGSVGLLSAALAALLYFALFRRWLKSRLTVRDQASNVDAVFGKTGRVTKRIAPQETGLVKVGAEEWRAELAEADGAALEISSTITVVSVEGVTLKVR